MINEFIPMMEKTKTIVNELSINKDPTPSTPSDSDSDQYEFLHLQTQSKGFRDLKSTQGDYRFKLGIIDFLTLYDTSKYLENEFKSKFNNVDKMEISAIDSKSY